MSGYMIAAIILLSFTLIFIVVYKTSTKVYDAKSDRYYDAYKKEHPEVNKYDWLVSSYAENEIRKTLFGKFCEFMKYIDKNAITLIIWLTILASAILLLVADYNASHELNELKEERTRMVENSTITGQRNIEEWQKFNNKVEEAYNKIPAFDRALFIDKNAIENMKIPINE